MPAIPGLRSCYSLTGRLVYFGRMLDKIHLHAAGRLPSDYHANLGDGREALFDARCCRFLGVAYAELKTRALASPAADEEILAWAHSVGGARTDDQCNAWNRFISKLGWRDDRTAVLHQRIAEFGLTGRPIETFFDLNEFDEGRDPVATRAWELREPRVIVITGVAGSGKTTVGRALADALGWRFNDADEFHPPANIAKMAAGQPLDDADRAPWLAALRAYIQTRLAAGENAVVTCSALRQRYRDVIVVDPGMVKLVFLHGAPALLEQRIAAREGHFMKPAMLAGQLGALEEPFRALRLDISATPAALVAEIRRTFSL